MAVIKLYFKYHQEYEKKRIVISNILLS